MQYVDGEGQCSFLCSYGTIYAWDVENTWLISLIWISGCRQIRGTQISSIRRHRKHSGLTTDKTRHRWQQTWLHWHQAECNWTIFHGIRTVRQSPQGLSCDIFDKRSQPEYAGIEMIRIPHAHSNISITVKLGVNFTGSWGFVVVRSF
jgi:hypothetical protein